LLFFCASFAEAQHLGVTGVQELQELQTILEALYFFKVASITGVCNSCDSWNSWTPWSFLWKETSAFLLPFRQIPRTKSMESFNESNGIVQQNQWIRWTKSMDSFHENAVSDFWFCRFTNRKPPKPFVHTAANLFKMLPNHEEESTVDRYPRRFHRQTYSRPCWSFHAHNLRKFIHTSETIGL